MDPELSLVDLVKDMAAAGGYQAPAEVPWRRLRARDIVNGVPYCSHGRVDPEGEDVMFAEDAVNGKPRETPSPLVVNGQFSLSVGGRVGWDFEIRACPVCDIRHWRAQRRVVEPSRIVVPQLAVRPKRES